MQPAYGPIQATCIPSGPYAMLSYVRYPLKAEMSIGYTLPSMSNLHF